MEEYYWAWAIFGSFLVITGFILYSLVIAVICDAVAVTEHDEEEAAKEKERRENEMETRDRVRELQKRVAELTRTQRETLAAIDRTLAGNQLHIPIRKRSLATGSVGKKHRLSLMAGPSSGRQSQVLSPITSLSIESEETMDDGTTTSSPLSSSDDSKPKRPSKSREATSPILSDSHDYFE